MRIIILFLFLTIPGWLFSQVEVVTRLSGNADEFVLTDGSTFAKICFDANDDPAVRKVAELFASDIQRVVGMEPPVVTCLRKTEEQVVIVGTVEKNSMIRELGQAGKLNLKELEGQWERYLIQTVDSPFPGIEKALVVVGSDQRGAAYGVFSISEAMGVSPWYWWADIPVHSASMLGVKPVRYLSKAPSVKYRGIFLNDEDWGLHPWAAAEKDPKLGDIGPNTYEKVFELLLRSKGNMVAPAMHECTKAFFTVPGNIEMAHQYGIMITTSHCEPLLYNNASEWDADKQGEWNYETNREEIVSVLDKRVQQAAAYDNIYTIALRGMHDEGMKGGSDDAKLNALEQAILDQRGLLGKHLQKPVGEIPQIFVPYKEVLGLYEKGLNLPDDITIVWPDDNYGYIKKLSNKDERSRVGGSGVYYHISYLGWPNDYLWLNTTPPALMFAEMHKAWSLGADKYWLINVGDIKPGEMGMQLFLDMAWDFEKFNFENINKHQIRILSSFFGEKYETDLAYILDRYYYHGFTRKPEYMTWDWRWNSLFAHEKVKDTDLSFINYREAETRLAEYSEITAKAKQILERLPEELKASFFQLVYYPVKGASLYNHELLIAQRNRWYAQQHRALTNQLALQVEMYHDSLSSLTEQYNSLLNGKWKGMMTAPGFLPTEQLSPTVQIELPAIARIAVHVEGQESDSIGQACLPVFHLQNREDHYFEVYNQGALPVSWTASASDTWIQLDKMEGRTDTQQHVSVSVDWALVPEKKVAEGDVVVSDGDQTIKIHVVADNRSRDSLVCSERFFVENNGVISISPTKYHRKDEKGGVRFQIIDGLGYANASLQLGNARYDDGAGSSVTYDFYTSQAGSISLYTYMLPLFPKDKSHSTRYGIQVDDSEMVVISNDVAEYSKEWAENVVRNSAINQTKLNIDKPGVHTLKIVVIDPGMILQKIVIDTGGLKPSYLGPPVQ